MLQVHAAVGAPLLNKSQPVPAVPEQGELLTQEADAPDRVLGKLLVGGYRVPVAPEKVAHGRARADPRQTLVLFLGKHRPFS